MTHVWRRGLPLLMMLLPLLSQGQKIEPAAGDGLYRFSDLGFEFKALQQPWLRLDPRSLNPNASLAFVRSSPHALLQISVGRKTADKTPADSLKAGLKKGGIQGKLHASIPYNLNGINGTRLLFTRVLGERSQNYVLWEGIRGGRVYNLMLRSDTESFQRGALVEEAKTVFTHFKPLATNVSFGPVERFRSKQFGYAVELDDRAWMRWPDFRETLPEAEFAALIPRHGGGIAIIPVYLGEREPTLPALTAGLISRFGINYETHLFSRKSPFTEGDLQGMELEFQRTTDSGDYLYSARTLKRDGRALLAVTWTDSNREGLTEVAKALSRVRFEERPAMAVGVSDFKGRYQAEIFNQIGIHYYRNDRYEEALDYFRDALEAKPADTTVFTNVLSTYARLERYAEGLAYYEQSIDRFADDTTALDYRAHFLRELGRDEEAVADYEKAFSLGHRSDEDFSNYLDLLWRTDRRKEAFAAAGRYLDQTGSRRVKQLLAGLHVKAEQYQQALELLQELREGGAFDAGVIQDLIDVQSRLGRHREALALSEALIANGNDTAYSRYLKGLSEYKLAWYKRAKASFEASLKLNPGNAMVRDYLDHVSALIGEGDNSGIKTPIEPVPLPDHLTDGAIPAGRAEDAYHLLFAKAIRFEREKEYRRTLYYRIKIFSTAGAARFGAFDLPFDPLSEQVFVNALVVKDEKGEVRATGDVGDYYVMDQTEDQIADGKKRLNIPVPGLEPGRTLELTVTYRDLRPPERFPFEEFSFTRGTPSARSALVISGDLASLKYRVTKEAREIKGDEDTLAWVMDSPPDYRWEPMQQDYRNFLPLALVGDKESTWQEMARNYLDLIADTLKPDGTAAKLIEGLAAGSKPATDRLVRYVQNQYSYRAIEFGRRALIPNPVEKIVRNRYGDCKDHSLLLYHLLRENGAEPKLALVNSGGKVWEGFPSLDQFNHMVVYCPSCSEGGYLDATIKELNLTRYLPTGLGGRKALILDGDKSELVEIPNYRATGNTLESDRKVSLTGDGETLVRERLALEGHLASSFRAYLKNAPAAERLARIQQLISGIDRRVSVKRFDVENLEDIHNPLILHMEYRISGQFLPVGHELTGRLPMLWELDYMSVEPVDDRVTPFRIGYPLTFTSRITVEPPKPFALAENSVKKPVSGKGDFVEWSGSMKVLPGTLDLHYRARLRPGRYGPKRYREYRHEMKSALSFLESPLSFQRTTRD